MAGHRATTTNSSKNSENKHALSKRISKKAPASPSTFKDHSSKSANNQSTSPNNQEHDVIDEDIESNVSVNGSDYDILEDDQWQNNQRSLNHLLVFTYRYPPIDLEGAMPGPQQHSCDPSTNAAQDNQAHQWISIPPIHQLSTIGHGDIQACQWTPTKCAQTPTIEHEYKPQLYSWKMETKNENIPIAERIQKPDLGRKSKIYE